MTHGSASALPMIIQGGMGIGVSNWTLANAVARRGHMGVVSGTCIDSLFVRRLQDGDLGGHLRRAMEHFPLPDVVEEVLDRYFQPDGLEEGEKYQLLPMWKQQVSAFREMITVLSSYVEVWLAKEGHSGPVGMNLLTKIQMPNLAVLYGSMLAEVDYVLMGAGIPKDIPGVLDRFAEHKPASLRLDVWGPRGEEDDLIRLDPADHWPDGLPEALPRPRFLPIIASHSLARMLEKKANGRVDGFIIEAPSAGGHNAPPRGATEVNERGEPIYGERDVVDLEAVKELGLPYWLAGGSGSPQGLLDALASGAAGIQVGTLFAYADESGLEPTLKAKVLEEVRAGTVAMKTDLRASPTGFPFKVVELEGTNALPQVYEARQRICDLGYLRTAYRRDDGRVGYRCPAEPVDTFLKKGGTLEETKGRKCLCNALMADIGHAQDRGDEGAERAILTSGDELLRMQCFLDGRMSYSAEDVLDHLLSGITAVEESKEAPRVTGASRLLA